MPVKSLGLKQNHITSNHSNSRKAFNSISENSHKCLLKSYHWKTVERQLGPLLAEKLAWCPFLSCFLMRWLLLKVSKCAFYTPHGAAFFLTVASPRCCKWLRFFCRLLGVWLHTKLIRFRQTNNTEHYSMSDKWIRRWVYQSWSSYVVSSPLRRKLLVL